VAQRVRAAVRSSGSVELGAEEGEKKTEAEEEGAAKVAPARRCAGARDSDTPGCQDNLCIVHGLDFRGLFLIVLYGPEAGTLSLSHLWVPLVPGQVR
jgi:hypothetical protein